MFTTQEDFQQLLAQAFDLRSQNLMEATRLTEKALLIAIEKQNESDIANAKTQLALFQFIAAEFEYAMKNSKEALTFYTSRGDKLGMANACYNIGSILYRTDSFHHGLQYLLDALTAYQELNDLPNQCRVLKSMGTIYEYFNDIDNASNAYFKCIELSKITGDRNAESNAYNPLSGIFLDQGNVEEAMRIIEKSICIKEQTNDRRGLAFAWYGRGKVWLKKNLIDEAITDFSNSLEIQKEANDRLGMGMVYNKLGIAYLSLGRYDEARTSFAEALQLSKQSNLKFIQFKAYQNLYTLSSKLNQTSEALHFLEQYISCKEQVINAETHNIIKSYEAISRIKGLEQETRRQLDRTIIIEEKNKELDSFFYRVSHDLKGPIASLMGLNQIVKLDVHDENALMYFNMYHHQILRINNIVMSLIEITRMKHLEVKKEKIDFENLIAECITSYQHTENFDRISFIKEIQTGIEYFSEWSILNTILQNLIENAIKYSKGEADAWVKIEVYQSKEHLVLVVEDNGQGIPEKHQEKIFDMFHRANDRVQGSGLGLYILKRAVERLKGSISVSSQLNQGSRFEVVLAYN